MKRDPIQQPRAELSDEEIEQHIDDATHLMFQAWARYREDGQQADRDQAVLMLRIQQDGIRARSPAAQAARWAEIERDMHARDSYFTSPQAVELGRAA